MAFLHPISRMNGCILTKLVQLYCWDRDKNWIDFGDLDPIFKVTQGLRFWKMAPINNTHTHKNRSVQTGGGTYVFLRKHCFSVKLCLQCKISLTQPYIEEKIHVIADRIFIILIVQGKWFFFSCIMYMYIKLTVHVCVQQDKTGSSQDFFPFKGLSVTEIRPYFQCQKTYVFFFPNSRWKIPNLNKTTLTKKSAAWKKKCMNKQ